MAKVHPESIKIKVGGETWEMFLGPAAFRLAKLQHGIEFKQSLFADPPIDLHAQFAYIGCLPNSDFDMDEVEFQKALARSDARDVYKKVGQAIDRMMASLSGEDEEESGDPTAGNGAEGE